MSDIKVGIYVPSYNRYDEIKTWNVINTCVYVVRESEEKLYRDAGVDKLLVAPDDEINSLPKVRQWIIDNTPEDVIIQVDDDIKDFAYINKNNQVLATKDDIDTEFLRIAQMLVDLDLGMASIQMTTNVLRYNEEFRFKGIIGGVVWINKKQVKGKYDVINKFKADIDMQLQELLHNRVILIPNYFTMKGEYNTNKGGANVGKNQNTVNKQVDYLLNKWGKTLEYDYKRQMVRIKVKR